MAESGRLEFVNGGWSMHDEAAAHYVAMVDQTTLGHAFLKEQLGVIPKTGWQLDPFGHSATQASLLSSAAGFTSLFFGRSDYRELQKRKRDKATEMIWKPTSAPRGQPDLFTVAMDFEMQEGEEQRMSARTHENALLFVHLCLHVRSVMCDSSSQV